MKTMTTCAGGQPANASAVSAVEVEKKNINDELWQACAGPLVNLPVAGTHVVYFPQGHSEQVVVSMKKDVDAQTSNYLNLPSKLICRLHNVILHADPETDKVYAQMTLQPVPLFDEEALLRSDLAMKANKPQTEFFCKTLTPSDTSTHGGFSVPRRAAEKIFPPLDFTMQRPEQEIVARDLHDKVWRFRHIYRGQPKRHLLTTGWSLFVSGKKLLAGDKVLFIRDEKQQLMLGIRRANQQPTNLSSSVLSSDSMHIGVLAAAAHAAANNSPFTVFYNPSASPSEFVIPLAKYYKSVCSNQIFPGMRFRMMFETEELGTRRYVGTITGISDLDPIRWNNSQWRNLLVGWDESTAGDKHSRVSIWEIEPVTAPFFISPTPPFFCSKRPRQLGMPDDGSSDLDNIFRRTTPWLMNMQQSSSLANSVQPNYVNSLPSSVLQNLTGADISPQQNNLQFDTQRMIQSVQPPDQLQKLQPSKLNPMGSILQPQKQLMDITQLSQNLTGHILPTSQVQSQMSSSQNTVQAQSVLQQKSLLSHQPLILSHSQRQDLIQPQSSDHANQQLHGLENQIQMQLLHKFHQQQLSLLTQQSATQQPSQLTQLQDHQKLQQLIDISPNFSKSMSASQMLDSSHTTSSLIHQTHVHGLQLIQDSSQTNPQFAQPPQEPKFQQLQPGMLSELPGHVVHILNSINHQPSAGGRSLFTGAAGGCQPAFTDNVPSCSTSPSTKNCPENSKNQHAAAVGDEIAQSSITYLNPTGFETVPSSSNSVEDLHQKVDVKSSLSVTQNQNQSLFTSQTFLNPAEIQIDYLDSSSSATSVASQNDLQIPPNNVMPFNSHSVLFRDAIHDGEVQGNLRSNLPFGCNIDSQLGMPMMPPGKDLEANISSGRGMISSFDYPEEAQTDISSSMVSQSFGVPDMTFNSMDSTVNDGSFLNRGTWDPPQISRMRTFTKVYKRGAVGRSVDITRYSGYDELKKDLAHRFGIVGQLEDRQRIGWKLVYVDHENDILLVGDDPWEEFVNCVRCIKILSPQEVQQMSLDGDFGNTVLSNQGCSSSGNGLN